ncbi:MAG: methyltransferase domain-containing protein [Chitinivibrionales bacterium]|nr:methyltransferase domain-containing protein [Chitinivibrionales bacterium]
MQKKFRKAMFITFRRYYLDLFLDQNKKLYHGMVIDIGGKKKNKRGSFSPPKDTTLRWIYLNGNNNADVIADACILPLMTGCGDVIVACELFEHLSDPSGALKEIARITRPGGKIVFSMPFLYAIHADPGDFVRWTKQKIEKEFNQAGFSIGSILPMGGFFAVVYDMMNMYLLKNPKRHSMPAFIMKKLLHLTRPAIRYLEHRTAWTMEHFTTGYFVIADKRYY